MIPSISGSVGCARCLELNLEHQRFGQVIRPGERITLYSVDWVESVTLAGGRSNGRNAVRPIAIVRRLLAEGLEVVRSDYSLAIFRISTLAVSCAFSIGMPPTQPKITIDGTDFVPGTWLCSAKGWTTTRSHTS